MNMLELQKQVTYARDNKGCDVEFCDDGVCVGYTNKQYTYSASNVISFEDLENGSPNNIKAAADSCVKFVFGMVAKHLREELSQYAV